MMKLIILITIPVMMMITITSIRKAMTEKER